MSVNLKRLSEQVIVITGASSGIGLATAEAAANRGAAVVLAARSEKTLSEVVARIVTAGGKAIAVTCDVSDRSQVDAVAAAAIEKYGRIDTWVNNAGLGMYGRADESIEADARRLFDVNFWGAVNGCLTALPHLKKNGGALITVGSEVSDAYSPLMAIYVASKHAIKGFVDVLRVEVEVEDESPIAITLIEPTAVNTPFPQHAKNYMSEEPKLPSPMIDPTDVAEAILAAAETPTREKKVGGMSVANAVMAKFIPSVGDKMAAGRVHDLSYAEEPRRPDGALHSSSESTGVAGRTHGAGGKEK